MMLRASRVVFASSIGVAAACSLVYDVDSITGEEACGSEHASCCASNACNVPLTCDPSSNRCERCRAEGEGCCFSKNLEDCVSDGAPKLNGSCNSSNACELGCSSKTDCAALSNAECCANAPGCTTPCSGDCVCKVCCVRCPGKAVEATAVPSGETCAQQATSCGGTPDDGYWSTTGC